MMEFLGYKRSNCEVGIRNKLLVIAVDECCDGICRQIAGSCEDAVVLTNTYTCMLGGNEETYNQMVAVGKNPNVAGVLVVAMGCGSIPPDRLAQEIKTSGKPAFHLIVEHCKGTRKAIEQGQKLLSQLSDYAAQCQRVPCPLSSLVIGGKCGGSDAISGMIPNAVVGQVFNRLVDEGAICITGELFELVGCEEILCNRAATPAVARKIKQLISNEAGRWSAGGAPLETMSIGNCTGGLVTIEEKALGALHKTGDRPIQDVLQINRDFVDRPTKPGFYLSEVSMLCGGSAVNFASLGAAMILWTSGGAGFEDPLLPVIRISGNPQLINEDIDIDATGIIDGSDTLSRIADRTVQYITQVASGKKTNIEGLGSASLSLVQKDVRIENILNIKCLRGEIGL